MTFNVFDMRGAEIEENDVVVCAFVKGNSSELRIGKVKEKKEILKRYSNRLQPEYNYYLKIRWIQTTSYNMPDKPTLISITPNTRSHLLKIDADGIDDIG